MTNSEYLAALESEYFEQPLAGQASDLAQINRLRDLLNMPRVDARLQEVATAPPAAKPVRKEKPKSDHTAARAVYASYLAKAAFLKPHREYAERVARATHGGGRTPVAPMATMGAGGGPLLCDHCGKPMLLEGGRWDRVPVDVAWAGTPSPPPNWVSYISGGMVVEVTYNGTLRIYHGHVGMGAHECSAKGHAAVEAAEAAFASERPASLNYLTAFLADEFPDQTERERMALLSEIAQTVWGFDPGVGVNRSE